MKNIIKNIINRLTKAKVFKMVICLFSFIVIVFTLYKGTLIVEKWMNNKIKNFDIPVLYNSEDGICINPNSIYFSNRCLKYPDSLSAPIPNGNLISSYTGKVLDSYSTKEYYTDYHVIPRFTGRMEWNEYLCRNVPEVEYYKEPYPATRTVWHGYFWYYDIYIFKCSERYNFFDTSIDKANKYFDEFKQKLKNYDYWSFTPNFYWNHPKVADLAISYCFKEKDTNVETVRTIIYSNEKIIMVEVRSAHSLVSHAEKILKDFTIYNPKSYKQKIQIEIYLPFILLFLAVSVFIFLILDIRKDEIRNIVALRMLRFSAFIVFCDMILVFIQWELLLNGYYVLDEVWKSAVIVFGLGLIFSYPLLVYTHIKCKCNYSYDYILPLIFKSYLIKHNATDAEIKSVISFICYPSYALASPFSVFVFIYIVSTSCILIFIFEMRTLFLWINNKTLYRNSNQIFKDYYLILDISTNASAKEIDNAYYKAMSNAKSKLMQNNIQEAYRILNSQTNIRTLYDAEYSLYVKSKDFKNYNMHNKKLEHDISFIQEELNLSNQIGKFHNKKNLVILSIFIFIIILIVSLFLLDIF